MARQHLNIGNALLQQGRQAAATLSEQPPVSEMPMVLTLDQLRPNPDNPAPVGTRVMRISRPPSKYAGWILCRKSPAIRKVKMSISSATAAIPAIRFCPNCGRKPAMSVFIVFTACLNRGRADCSVLSGIWRKMNCGAT
ncbi:hypothetical protein XENE109146_19225 [Xenorhabdus nematophila]